VEYRSYHRNSVAYFLFVTRFAEWFVEHKGVIDGLSPAQPNNGTKAKSSEVTTALQTQQGLSASLRCQRRYHSYHFV